MIDSDGLFYKKNKDRLFAYLMRMTGDYHLSSDILQESYTRYLERYRERSPKLQLLYTIARNTFFDHVRKQKRCIHLEEGLEDTSENQEHRFMVREEYRGMIEALEILKKDDREMLALVADGDLSYSEIGEITGNSEANVKVKVHRARIRLKSVLKGKG